MFCSLPAPHILHSSPALAFSPSLQTGIKAASCHGDGSTAAMLGMGAGPASRSAGPKSTSASIPTTFPGCQPPNRGRAWPERTAPGRESPAVRDGFASVAFVIIVIGGKKVYVDLFPKSFPLSQILGHLWSKRQLSGISRGHSRLVLAGNSGGQQGPCRERRRFRGWDGYRGKVQRRVQGMAGAQLRGREALQCQRLVEKAYKIAGSNERREE